MAARGGYALVKRAQCIDKGAVCLPQRDKPQANFVADQINLCLTRLERLHQRGDAVLRVRLCLRLRAFRRAVHGHEQTGEPQGEAIYHQQSMRVAVRVQGGGQVGGFKGDHAWHALGAFALVAGYALAHFFIPRLGSGDVDGAAGRGGVVGRLLVWRLCQPVRGYLFGAGGFAAFLAAQYQFVVGLHGGGFCLGVAGWVSVAASGRGKNNCAAACGLLANQG